MALRTPAFNDAKSYGFEWLRAMLEAGLQEGVIGAGDLKVTAAAAGGQRVDIAAGIGLVKGDSGVAATGLSQGLFLVVNDAAVANAVTLNASDVTNPRIDQIVLRVRDSSDLASGADDALFEVVQGVATAGATLDNRNGAAALPNDRIRLADVLVPAGSSAVSAANVRDRRPWARGARFGGRLGSSTTTTASTPGVSIDATNGQRRLECSGVPVVARFSAIVRQATSGSEVGVALMLDAALAQGWNVTALAASPNISFSIEAVLNSQNSSPALPAGSHLFNWNLYASGAATASLIQPPAVQIYEDVRANADNGLV